MTRQLYEPMLATAEQHLPSGDGWIFELKLDGYRAIAYVRDGSCELLSRRGLDLRERFAPVADAMPGAVASGDLILDGEICRLDAEGRTSFSALQRGTGPLVYYAFDVIERAGESLIKLPLSERRAILEEEVTEGPVVRISHGFDDGQALLAAALQNGLEGVIAKERSSAYLPGRRSRTWLKHKLQREETATVVGYTPGRGNRSHIFGSLILAQEVDGKLVYAGRVGTGFNDAELKRLLALLKPLHRASSALARVPPMPGVARGDIQWVEPELRVTVRYTERTTDGRFRHPVYAGLVA